MSQKEQTAKIALLLPGGVSQYDEGLHIPSLFRLIERLSERFDITVYSLIAPQMNSFSRNCGKARIKYLTLDYRAHWTRKLAQFLLVVSKDHLKEKYSLIHGMLGLPSELATVLLGKTLRVPTVISFLGGETANLPSFKYGNMRFRLVGWLTLMVARRVDILTLLSNYQLRQLVALSIQRNRIFIVPHGVDIDFFKSTGKELKPPYHLIHVGNQYPVKDQATLLRSFKLISDRVECRLRIIGRDYMNGSLHSLARDLGIANTVEFSGFIRNEELPEHFRWAHVMLHTSAHEGAGVVISEAAASGVVVAGTRVGLIADLEPEKVIGVDVGDYTALAEEVLSLLNDPNRYQQIRLRALAWARNHDLQWTANRFSEIYRHILDERSHRKG